MMDIVVKWMEFAFKMMDFVRFAALGGTVPEPPEVRSLKTR